jgi:hypothetical protein
MKNIQKLLSYSGLVIAFTGSMLGTIYQADHLISPQGQNVYILYDFHLTPEKSVIEIQNEQISDVLFRYNVPMIIEARSHAFDSSNQYNDTFVDEWDNELKQQYETTCRTMYKSLISQANSGLGLFYQNARSYGSTKLINIDTHRNVVDLFIDYLSPELKLLMQRMSLYDFIQLLRKLHVISTRILSENKLAKNYDSFLQNMHKQFHITKSMSQTVIKELQSNREEIKKISLLEWIETYEKVKNAAEQTLKTSQIADKKNVFATTLKLLTESSFTFLSYYLELKVLNELVGLKSEKNIIIWLGGNHCKRISSFLQQKGYTLRKTICSAGDQQLKQYADDKKQCPWIDLTQVLPKLSLQARLRCFWLAHKSKIETISVLVAGGYLAYHYRNAIKNMIRIKAPHWLLRYLPAFAQN